MTLRGAPKAFYRPLLKKALSHVLRERDLWIYGVFAMVIGSGGALETVIRAQNGIGNIGTLFSYRYFPLFESFRQWATQLLVVTDKRAAVTITILLILVLFIISLAASAQGILVSTTKKHPKRESFRNIFLTMRKHFWAILAIDLFWKLALLFAIFILLSPVRTFGLDLFINVQVFLQILVSYALILSFTVIAIFAITARVNHEQTLFGSIKEATSVFMHHLVTSFELSFLLFFVSLLAGVLAIITLLLLSIPYTLLYLLAAYAGSVLATSLVSTILWFIAIVLLFIIGGATTAFNYSILAMAYKDLRRDKFKSKLNRIFRTNHWL
ncbi:MAG: hypothetical protein O2877_02705 [bacterium]|nr:hypothetical protein [bacterium]